MNLHIAEGGGGGIPSLFLEKGLRENVQGFKACLGAGKGEKKRQIKGQKNEKKYFCFFLNQFQSVAHYSTSIFQGFFKTIVYRSVALVKNIYGPFQIFLHRLDFDKNKKIFDSFVGLFSTLPSTQTIKVSVYFFSLSWP